MPEYQNEYPSKFKKGTLGYVLDQEAGVQKTMEARKQANKMKTALITGITGQDGSYLAELLLEKGYEVHGIIRRSSTFSTGRIDHIFGKLNLHYGDLCDGLAIAQLVNEIQPDEIYNLAAQSHVKVSFDQPAYTISANALGTLHILEAACKLNKTKTVKYYQASSSEMYGEVLETPQTEKTPFNPRSPYACSKVYGFYQTVNYREAYDLFACNGILFNHESERRLETFVTRKITKSVARIRYGLQDKLYLGNIKARRDWGYAGDYVRAMWLMLQQETPDDYVIATGETHSVEEFLEIAFSYADLDWKKYVEIDERYLRPSDVELLLGDSSKAREKLGWEPTISFNDLVVKMMDYDLELAFRESVEEKRRPDDLLIMG